VNGTYLLIDAIGTEFYRAPSALKLVKSNLDAAEVEQILEDRRSEKGAWEYLVRWKGTKAEEWVLSKDFHDLTPIRKFVEKKVLRKNVASQEPECITGIDLKIPVEKNAKRKNDANQNQEFISPSTIKPPRSASIARASRQLQEAPEKEEVP
jgi:hypothetical protein